MTDSFGDFTWMVLVDFAVCFGLDPTDQIVGYDPQKLLPSPERLQREWIDGMIALFCSPTIDLRKHFDVPLLIPGDTIHMTPLVTPFVSAVQMADWREAELRTMAHHTGIAIYIGDSHTDTGLDRRWNVMSGIVKAPPALEDYDIPVKTSAGLRDKSYLKHDPSKKHRRRRR